MKLADEILKNINNNYLQGLASLTDLLDAENASTQAQNNYTAAILDYKLAEIKLIKSKGQLKLLSITKMKKKYNYRTCNYCFTLIAFILMKNKDANAEKIIVAEKMLAFP
jgi:hypothetical protein